MAIHKETKIAKSDAGARCTKSRSHLAVNKKGVYCNHPPMKISEQAWSIRKVLYRSVGRPFSQESVSSGPELPASSRKTAVKMLHAW